jgi:hypothetical protein
MFLADISGPGLLVVLIVLFFLVAVPLWALIDVVTRPAAAFKGARENKTVWIVVIAGSWFMGLAWLTGGVYLLFFRRKVRRHMDDPAEPLPRVAVSPAGWYSRPT